MKTEPCSTPIFKDLGSEKEPKEGKPREECEAREEGSDGCGS